MRLFTRTLLQGLHDGLVEHGGMPPFPNDKIASEIFDEISAAHGLPPYLERRLDKTAAVTLSRAIASYSEKLAGAGMVAPPARVALVKQASQRDLGERAMVVASYYMQKAADEGSLVPSGPNTLAAAAVHDQIAAVDQRNRPDGRYGVPIGTTDMPMPGMIGREMPAPGAPTVGATYKGANAATDLLGRARAGLGDFGDKLQDAATGAGNAMGYYGRQAASYLNPADAIAGLKDTVPQVRDAHNWLASDPSTLSNLGHTHNSMRALRKEKAMEALHHMGRLGALGGLATAGALAGYGGYRALTRDDGHETTASVKEALAPMSPEMIQALNELPPEHLLEMKRTRQWLRVQEALANAPKLPDPAQNRDPVSAVVNAAYKRTEAPVAHPIPDSARSLDVGAPAATTLRGVGQGILDELGTSPLAHARHFEHRDFGGKLRSLGAVGAQGAAALGAGYGLYRGGKALYDHLTEEKAASEGPDGAALAPILEACQEAGVTPTPELVAALHHALEGGGAPPTGGGDPTKQASAADTLRALGHAVQLSPATLAHGVSDAQHMLNNTHLTGTRELIDAERNRRNLAAAALGVQGLGAGAAALGAYTVGRHVLGGKEDAPGGGHYGHASEAAHWDAILKAAGEGSLTPSAPNTLAAAAAHDQIAAVDKKNRPEGKYKVPVGQTQLSTAAGEIGAEKKAAEAAYWANVKQAAAEWGAYLPAAMPLEMKRTAIEKVASLPPSQREQFVRALHG